ncbi:hypothetical protein [Flavobacterium sp. LAR06]|uniref:hypothetical protein n=1 Tax=Flavobacterium sp. LAR06 TaxID=3064897 RepID=UPI0035C1ABDF
MLKEDILNETVAPYNKIGKVNPEEALNYKELAKARKETIEGLKKMIAHLEAQLAETNQNKK